MRYLLLISALLLAFSSCKKDDGPQNVCESNSATLSIGVYSWGPVKHPYPADIHFPNSNFGIAPELDLDGFVATYSNTHIILDGVDYFPSDSVSYVDVDSLALGTHQASISTSCVKEIITSDINYCDCTGPETYAEREFEVIEPTYIVFDTLIFSQALGCNWDFPGNGCPDLDFDFQFYEQDLPIPIEYNYSNSNGPFIFAMKDTIAIYPSTCTFKLDLSDADQVGNDEEIDQWTLDNSTMGDWQTGLHTLETGMSFYITRLN